MQALTSTTNTIARNAAYCKYKQKMYKSYNILIIRKPKKTATMYKQAEKVRNKELDYAIQL